MVSPLLVAFMLLFVLAVAIQRMRAWNMRRPQLALLHLRGRKLQDIEAVRAKLPKTNRECRNVRRDAPVTSRPQATLVISQPNYRLYARRNGSRST
jgi:hypothetical protein